MLYGRRILVGVCGSIAAYKTAFLVRLLIKAGAEVRIVMTPSATRFIGALTFRTLTGNPVFTDLWENADVADLKSPHIHLVEWAEFFLIAPVTADTLTRMALGRVENALDAVYLSARCPIALAPAMDFEMYQHDTVQYHLNTLEERGHAIAWPEKGELASGFSGEGRMQEPEKLLEFIKFQLGVSSFWQSKKVLVSAGPTFERIDPVRYIGNFASGKMGFALAQAARDAGASVCLVTGPVALPPIPGIQIVSVESASQMADAMFEQFPDADFTFMAAAVADYKPEITEEQKIKKQEERFTIQLIKNIDILASLGTQKKAGQKLIGFALETQNEVENARKKLKKKNLDMIVLNSLNDQGAGFGFDTNEVLLLFPDGNLNKLELNTKAHIASEILTNCETL